MGTHENEVYKPKEEDGEMVLRMEIYASGLVCLTVLQDISLLESLRLGHIAIKDLAEATMLRQKNAGNN